MDGNKMSIDMQGYYARFLEIAQKIIKDPAAFYRDMPRSGGLVEPLIFMVSMGVLAGIVRAVLGILGIGLDASFFMALASIIIVPVFVAAFGFIGAGILFLIWNVMRSQQPYEVAFRCLAYSAAITPIAVIFHAVPYIGSIVGFVWTTYLLVNASTEVHHIQPRLAWIVFGAICVVFALTSISSQLAARRLANRLDTLQQEMRQIDKMNPGEAAQAMGEFLKSLQKGAGKP
jgi:hypothetical protein